MYIGHSYAIRPEYLDIATTEFYEYGNEIMIRRLQEKQTPVRDAIRAEVTTSEKPKEEGN